MGRCLLRIAGERRPRFSLILRRLISIQILLNPAKATKSNLAGITHVASRMDWYCAVTEHLLKKDHIDESFESILPQVEAKILALYKALLVYQMKSVCSYYRHQGLVFLRSLANLDDWDADLKAVTDREDALQRDSDQYNKLHAKTALAQLAGRAREMEDLLGDIYQSLRDFLALQRELQLDNIDMECRRALRIVDPRDDLRKIEAKKDTLLPDACEWILHTDQYAAFTTHRNDEHLLRDSCRLLWIKGHAGTGKTMLLMGIIRSLERQQDFLAPGLSYFFYQATDATLNNATAALRSLVWMLLVEQPHLISHLRKKYKDSGAALFQDPNAFFALSEAFKSMLSDPKLSPVLFVVDALDECALDKCDLSKPGLNKFLELISYSIATCEKVKWLVSSRPEVDVLAKLKTFNTSTPVVSEGLVELDAQSLAGPVDAYIKHKLSILNRKGGYDASLLDDLSVEVHRRAMNTFLWVALAFKVLESTHPRYAIKRIKDMPPTLSELYDHMMTRIENVTEIDVQDCKRVLICAVLAFRPLSLCELAILCDMPADITETAVQLCGSFLTAKEETVYLIHQSAKDYLDKNYESKLQPAGMTQGHTDISSRSIAAMSSILKQNIYKLDYGFKPKDMANPRPDPLAPIQYACVFWADHLASNGESHEYTRALADGREVFTFLKDRLLHWLESLSLLGKLPEGMQLIQKLLRIAKVCS